MSSRKTETRLALEAWAFADSPTPSPSPSPPQSPRSQTQDVAMIEVPQGIPFVGEQSMDPVFFSLSELPLAAADLLNPTTTANIEAHVDTPSPIIHDDLWMEEFIDFSGNQPVSKAAPAQMSKDLPVHIRGTANTKKVIVKAKPVVKVSETTVALRLQKHRESDANQRASKEIEKQD